MSIKEWVRHEDDIINHVLERLEDWRQSGYRPAQTFFTSGIERTIASLIETERSRYLRHASELCAQHVESRIVLARGGMPAEPILLETAKTFRAEDWYKVLAGEVK